MTKKLFSTPLGYRQVEVLRTLKYMGSWTYNPGINGGWVYDTPTGTKRIMKTLVRRGLAMQDEHTFTITPQGEAFAEFLEVVDVPDEKGA